MTGQLQRRLFTTDEYFRMIEAGILTKNDRVELIEGEIVETPPIGSNHAGLVNRLGRLLRPGSEKEAVVALQNPVRLNDDSAPQPDVAVLKWRDDEYMDSHPVPEEIMLLVEIADTSLLSDRRVKAPVYAQAGIPETWIVNIANRSVEVHREPSEAGYRAISILRGKDRLSPLMLPSISFMVEDLLP